MFLLDQNSELKLVRGAAKITNEMIVTVSAVDLNISTGAVSAYLSDIITTTNGTTAVVICGSPSSGDIRVVKRIEVNNQDTVLASVSFIESVSGTDTTIKSSIDVAADNSLNYENENGWYITDAAGSVTGSLGNLSGDVTGPSTATVVSKINGTQLGSTGATSGNVLLANGSEWVSTALGGDVSSISSAGQVVLNGVSGGAFKEPVAWTSLSPLPSNTYDNGSSGAGATLTGTSNGALVINSVTVSLNARILVNGESTNPNNGIYILTQVGNASQPYILTRTTDFDTSEKMLGGSIVAEVSNANDNTANWLSIWIFHNGMIPIVVGTDSIGFERIIPSFLQRGDGNILQWDSNRNAVGNTMSGDATIDDTGAVTISGINGTPITLETITERVFRSKLEASSAVFTNGTSTTAYFVYLGKTATSITPKYVEGFCVGAGAGVTLIEVGLFSSPNPPNKSNQTLTKLVSTTVSSFTANTIFRNSTAMNTAVSAGVHLWAGIRVAFATTAPSFAGLSDDFSEGYLERFASAGAFSSTASYAATIPTTAAFLGGLSPDLRATLD